MSRRNREGGISMNESIIDQESVALLKHMFIDTGALWYIIAIIVLIFSFRLLFFWEKRHVKLWLRLPIINILTFIVLLLMGIIEEFYLTCHPEERTPYFRTSIFQKFFTE